MTPPVPFVFKRDPVMPEIARLVVVAFVEVEFVVVRDAIVEDAFEIKPVKVAVPVNVGEFASTNAPVPVSSEIQLASWLEFEKSVVVAIAVKPPEAFPMMRLLFAIEVRPVPP